MDENHKKTLNRYLQEADGAVNKQEVKKAIKAACKYVTQVGMQLEDDYDKGYVCQDKSFGPAIRKKGDEILVLVDEPDEYTEDGETTDNPAYRSGGKVKPWYVIVKAGKVVDAIDGKEKAPPAEWKDAEDISHLE